ncbi:MAG: ABC transporter permease [Sphingomonadales bacterium]|nr:ABC transporter permease [Sphingomonadales bacterium]PIX64086.1 MAG: ABC transporter [Sphingomonadales bacterium CG_4_10_14_3_um_filter_58_15]NCO49057.1 ABC transporter permease [Sphingomonadales bacterium]NCO99412.1 ABC transporter permease [Sphingomonadales bacterium]NCP27064.1 ABC transporter permease [Sphingomonadales bacterium]
MGGLIFRRLMTAIPTLLVIILASFFLMRLAPGGPFDGERPLDPATQAALQQAYGLDRPLWEQAWLYISRLVQGDFGPSLVYRDFTVSELIAQGLPISLTLGGLAILLALLIGVTAGLFAAVRAGKATDKTIMMLATVATALPTFVTGPALALFFGLWLGLLPVSGTGEGGAWLIMPVVALALPVSGAIAKLTRAGLASVLKQDHIRSARARGLSETKIMLKHGLRTAMVPVASYLGPAAAGLLTGAVVVETVFGLPGLGRYFVQGALNRDYPLVLGVVTLYAALIILFNLFADLIYGWLDPRMRDG